MRLIFAGTPAVAIPSLEAILRSRHELAAVVTRPDAPAGRRRHLTPSPVRTWAAERGVRVLTPRKPSESEFLAQLTDIAPDCCPVVAYGALLPPQVLTVPRLGWVNLHFSLLPAWRGAAPVQRAILHGDDVTGATVFQIREGLDDGPTLGQLTESIRPSDTAGVLLGRLATYGADLLVSCLDALEEGRAVPIPQPVDGISHAPKLTVDEARIDWTKPAFAIDRQIRACTPSPGAWTTFRGKRIKLGPVRLSRVSEPSSLPADALVAGQLALSKRNVHIGTSSGVVTLGDVQPEGKKSMPATDWARGVHLGEGEATFMGKRSMDGRSDG